MNRTELFLKHFESFCPAYLQSIKKGYNANTKVFEGLAEDMLKWAESLLGEDYLNILMNGYVHFVNDVNCSQIEYEKDRAYKSKSYAKVYESVYDNTAYMENYHWGVFTTTFAWEHHLKIYKYFVEYFVNSLGDSGVLLDLGFGSGIWSILLLKNKNGWRSTGVDISGYSTDMAIQLSVVSGFMENTKFIVEDALEYKFQHKADAVISCFLLEHLEKPERLFKNIAVNLKDGGYAFVTAALTAAEVDHIFEFKHESEIVELAERNGFRVISFLSASPEAYPSERYFLPRSMALVLRKRNNPIW